MHITIFSTAVCPNCLALKEYLDAKKLLYVEKLIDQDEAARQEMLTHSNGFMGVPFVLVEKDGGEKVTVVGFDKGKLDSIFT
jgi:glutaredoxin